MDSFMWLCPVLQAASTFKSSLPEEERDGCRTHNVVYPEVLVDTPVGLTSFRSLGFGSLKLTGSRKFCRDSGKLFGGAHWNFLDIQHSR
jgi:hypothetical protein